MNNNMVKLTINDIPVTVERGTTVLSAAESIGIEIPTLCHLKGLNPDGSCRICVVEITSNGRKRLAMSCSSFCEDGDVIETNNDAVRLSRRRTLDIMLSQHRIDCFSCGANGACKLQTLAQDYGLEGTTYRVEPPKKNIDASNKFFEYDASKCILCHRCVNICKMLTGRGAIEVMNRGMDSVISSHMPGKWGESTCESCGNCVQACPTGALTYKKRKSFKPFEIEKKVVTTCPHCATGCQIEMSVKNGQIVEANGANGPSNQMLLCVKGRYGSFNFAQAGDRLKYPLIKNKKTGEFERATWDEALDYVAKRFMEIKEKHGSEALAGFACSRSTNEDVYMVQKMVRTCFGTNNVDNCARVCHSASVAGLAMTLGSGAMTNPIKDITRKPDVILLVGSNPEEAHPVVGMQIRQAVKRGCKLIVVDPRDIDLSKKADIHLKLKPGTNVAFVNGMMHIIIEEGLADMDFIKERTEGFEEIRDIVKDYTPEKVAEICHIDAQQLREAALMYAKADKAPIIYCLGVTEHSTGTEGVMSMSNLALLVGKLGREGCGVNPLRGQNNVQGACDMGALPTDFPGYQKVENPDTIAKFEKAWGVKLNPKKGLTATEVFPEAIKGNIKGLYICGEDPVVTDPDTNHVIKTLESLEFFVIQELFMTETAKYADVVLPGTSYVEKEGTFSNTERRVQRVRKCIEPAGEARLDTDIIIDLMRRMGYPQEYMTSAQIMDEISSLVPSFGGISHERLDSAEVAGQGLQWPCPDKDHPGTYIMHVGKFTRGRAMFYPAQYIPSSELPDEEYPLIMMTGRILYHYNTRAMTGRTPELMEIAGHSFIEINTEDAKRLGIKHLDRVRVTSRRGSIESEARVSDKTCVGETWMPFHFQDGNANWLTNAALDKYARIPEYKVCAIKIEKA